MNGLDQFFTKPAVAQECWDWLHQQIDTPADAHYVEPSVGAGAFYNLMPPNRRTGYELAPSPFPAVKQGDFLAVQPLTDMFPGHTIVVGNPPFGPRAATAIDFINHSFALGAEIVAMIVPAALRCHGKTRGETCDQFISAHTINQANWRVRDGKTYGGEWIGKCDMYLPCAGFGDYMKAHDEFCQKEMIGVRVLRDRDRLLPYLRQLDWTKNSRLGVGGRLGITPDVIKRAVIKGGFIDPGSGGGVARMKPPMAERRIKGGYSINQMDVSDDWFILPDGTAKQIQGCAFVIYKKANDQSQACVVKTTEPHKPCPPRART